jgi:hypothetical protein
VEAAKETGNIICTANHHKLVEMLKTGYLTFIEDVFKEDLAEVVDRRRNEEDDAAYDEC